MDIYTIQGAVPAQLDALIEFYASDERDSLPTPSYGSLRKALDGQSFLMTVDEAGAIAATAAYFDHEAPINNRVIYELAGTRVKNTIGRLKEVRLQQILLALRIIIVATAETETGPLSLISSAKHASSIGNLGAIGMEQIHPLPRWFEFDTRSWTQMQDRQAWRHFAASAQTLDNAIELLNRIDFARGEREENTSVRPRKNKLTAAIRNFRLKSYSRWAWWRCSPKYRAPIGTGHSGVHFCHCRISRNCPGARDRMALLPPRPPKKPLHFLVISCL